jgi:hypothetical protein
MITDPDLVTIFYNLSTTLNSNKDFDASVVNVMTKWEGSRKQTCEAASLLGYADNSSDAVSGYFYYSSGRFS